MAECSSIDSLFISSDGLNTNAMFARCKICAKRFASPIQSTIHHVTCHRLLPCTKCLQLFRSRNDLDFHTKYSHGNDGTHCSLCDSPPFDSAHMLSDHMQNIHRKRYCGMCSALVKSTVTPQMHNEQIHKFPTRVNCSDAVFSFERVNRDGVFGCQICHQQIPLDRIFVHSLTFHKCSLGFICANILERRHTSQVLRAVECAENEVDDLVCSVCKYKFTAAAPKIFHQIYCEGIRICRRCYGQFDCDNDFDDHKGLCDGGLSGKVDVCSFCDEEEYSNDQDQHLLQTHGIDKSVDLNEVKNLFAVNEMSWNASNHLCNFCREDLSSIVTNVESLTNHFVIKHKFSQNAILKMLKKSTVDIGRSKPLEKRKILFHEVESTAIDGDVDDGGGVIFDFDAAMVNVVYSSATDSDSCDDEDIESRATRPTFLCTFCPFKTGVKCMLASHLNQKHGFAAQIKPNRCTACCKVFTTHANLQRHYKQVHHKRNATPFQCPFCRFAVKGKQGMRKHIALHVESTYHPCTAKDIGFNCKYCHYSFWLLEKLNEHTFNRHPTELERNFLMCSLCAAMFINKKCLCQHQQLVHPTTDALTPILYQCKLCFTTHIDINDIRTHMTAAHAELKSSYCSEPQCHQYINGSYQEHYSMWHRPKVFECCECTKRFTTKSYARQHFAETHADDPKRLDEQY